MSEGREVSVCVCVYRAVDRVCTSYRSDSGLVLYLDREHVCCVFTAVEWCEVTVLVHCIVQCMCVRAVCISGEYYSQASIISKYQIV